MFNIEVTGNNVYIVEGTNPKNPNINYRLDISYSMGSTDPKVSINPISGTLTMTGRPQNEVTVIITTNGQGGPYYNNTALKKPTKVKYEWLAPRIGEFAYSDGTFSSDYSIAKNLIGVVFDKKGDGNEGTVYILGKEYTNTKEWSSYPTSDGFIEGSSTYYADVDDFVDSLKSTFTSLRSFIPSGLKNYDPIHKITKAEAEAINELQYPE
jgi:hypothetical protein